MKEKSHHFIKNKNKQTKAQFTNLLEPNENTKVKLTNEEQKFSLNKKIFDYIQKHYLNL